MALNFYRRFLRSFSPKNDGNKSFKLSCSDAKNGCSNFLEVASFFLIIFLILGFVNFCQRKNGHTNSISIEKIEVIDFLYQT